MSQVRSYTWASRTGLLAVATALLALPGVARPEFVSPEPGVVRGTVPIQVDLGAAHRGGIVQFYIGKTGEPLQFQLATVADDDGLFTYNWETQTAREPIQDGEYRIAAFGSNAAGEPVGQAVITIEVQNQVPRTQIPREGILLRHNLTPGRETRYVAETDLLVSLGEAPEGRADLADVRDLNTHWRSFWENKILWRNPDGRAYIRNNIYKIEERDPDGKVEELEQSGKSTSMLMNPKGDYVLRSQYTQKRFPYGEISLEFPEQPVQIGEVWRSPITFLLLPQEMQPDVAMGTHFIRSVEWHAGYRTAVIESEWEAGPYTIGIEADLGEGKQPHVVRIVVRGQRTTYFAYQPEMGKPLRIDENLNQYATLELTTGGGSQGGLGVPGSGMPGGMTGPPMGPPGFPGAPTGPPGFPGAPTGPPGFSGAPGSGGYPMPGAPGSGGYPMPGAPGSGGYPMPGAPGSGGYPMPGAPGSGGYPMPGAPMPGSGGSSSSAAFPGSGGMGPMGPMGPGPMPGSGSSMMGSGMMMGGGLGQQASAEVTVLQLTLKVDTRIVQEFLINELSRRRVIQ